MSEHWVGSWSCAQQIPEPHNALRSEDLTDVTLRQVVHLSMGGGKIRVHLSNAFGTEPLRIDSVHVARASAGAQGKIETGTDSVVRFSGNSAVTIPPGAEYVSDAISFAADALSSVAVSFHVKAAPVQQTGHPGSRATSFFVHGDHGGDGELPGAKTFEHWMMLSGIDVASTASGFAIVALGDSITDGHGATTNGNDRWTDVLAQRLQAVKTMKDVSVLNLGIGGNHLLTDGLGPNALARFDRDVLAQTGVRYILVLEGVNDLGGLARETGVSEERHRALVAAMKSAYEQIVLRAHAHGLKVIGGTILPYVGSDYYHPAAENEADRLAVNAWIRTAGHFDAVVDFDQLTADPKHPDRLLPAYDSGDHLHPSVGGYAAMATAIPLELFTK